MNFWQKTKRFSEPLWSSKKNLILHILLHIVYEIGKIVPVILLILSQNLFRDISGFLWASLLYIVVGAVLTTLLRRYYWLRPTYGYMEDIIEKHLPAIIKKDNTAYERYGTGRMVSIVDRGMSIWSILLINGMIFFINTLIVGSFVMGRMFFVGIEYGVSVIFVMAILLLWITWNNNGALVWKKLLKEKEGEFTRSLVKIFMSKFEILQNAKIPQEIHSLATNINEQYDIAERRNDYLARMYDIPYFAFLAFIVGIFCWYYFGHLTLSQSLLVEIIGISLLAQSMLLPYIDFIKDFSKDFVHVEKLWDFMDNTPQIQGYDTGDHFHFKQGNFDLKNLSFSYRSDPGKLHPNPLLTGEGASSNVLSHFSLSIQGGKRTALVGRSGSGKTTLMKLLAGYMRPTSGELLIDGQDITSVRLDSYYPHIGYLTQEPSVFDGTIEENLLYGMSPVIPVKGGEAVREPESRTITSRSEPNILDQRIAKAIELAECQFIYELEHGLQTEIGERGVRLSGGQKQRLAIAKIFLKDPEIILLDEPTAALDSYSEEKVAKAFEHLFVGRTVIVIAHRLQTVKSADDIIVLEKGKVVERGTHKQLLKLGGKYAGMVDLQSGFVIEEGEEGLKQ